jgi:xanthine dehydrogenase YagT iron-sulfur-binding subunit
MSETNTGPFRINRRRFVGASAAVGGMVAAAVPLLAGCAADEQAEGTVTVNLTINGDKRAVAVDNRTSLLDLLRERTELTGTKKGCNQGACGAARCCWAAGG